MGSFSGICLELGIGIAIGMLAGTTGTHGSARGRMTILAGELGGTPLGGSAAEFGAILSEATEKWAKVIKFAGIKAE